MARFRIVCEGATPLIMHSARLVDPLDPIVREIRKVTAKRTKTDEDHEQVAHLEWLGGMYFEDEIGPYVPAANLQKCIVEGARLSRDGKKVERGVLIETLAVPVEYDGPRDLQRMYADKRFVHRAPVKVGQARVMRTRPVFRHWAVQCTGVFNGGVIDLDALRAATEAAGSLIGLGDGRPMFGRFVCNVEAE